jgi:hypothetical protein
VQVAAAGIGSVAIMGLQSFECVLHNALCPPASNPALRLVLVRPAGRASTEREAQGGGAGLEQLDLEFRIPDATALS